MGDIIFRVYGDGELLYESNPSGTGANNAQFFSIPIAHVKELRLEADMNGSDLPDDLSVKNTFHYNKVFKDVSDKKSAFIDQSENLCGCKRGRKTPDRGRCLRQPVRRSHKSLRSQIPEIYRNPKYFRCCENRCDKHEKKWNCSGIV